VRVLYALADAGDWIAAVWLACLFPGRDTRDKAARVLRAQAAAQGWTAAFQRVEQLDGQGRTTEAQRLRRRCLDDLVASSVETTPTRKAA
jgi:hypothetical protein